MWLPDANVLGYYVVVVRLHNGARGFRSSSWHSVGDWVLFMRLGFVVMHRIGRIVVADIRLVFLFDDFDDTLIYLTVSDSESVFRARCL